VGLCRIRMKEGPALRVPGWPWVPGLFLLFVASSTVVTVAERPVEGIVGFSTLGILFALYAISRANNAKRKQTSAAPSLDG